MREVFITAAARTAIGDFGGGLKDVAPIDLGATVVKAVLQRSGVDGSAVGMVPLLVTWPSVMLCTLSPAICIYRELSP